MAKTTIMAMDTITPTRTDAEWLLPLTQWLSPSYPVGAYSYSHGLEWAVETGAVHDRATLEDYAATSLEQGGGWTDLVLLAAAWQAADDSTLDAIVARAAALRGSAELAIEAMQQGAAFVAATCAAWPGTGLDALAARRGKDIPYPVAVGTACAGRVPLQPALAAYGHAFVANLVSAGVRLIPLGQTAGQQVVAALVPRVAVAASRAMATSLDRLGTAAPMIEIASMRHETQYTRLFRS
jgi:urease accessory protein